MKKAGLCLTLSLIGLLVLTHQAFSQDSPEASFRTQAETESSLSDSENPPLIMAQASQIISQPLVDFESQSVGPQSVGPMLNLKGFTDISYLALGDYKGVKNNSTFALGQLDLFITSQLSDSISFLNEILFEFEETNESVLHIARLMLQYSLTDYLNIKVGRMHTAIGYWNSQYHHSAWLYTTAMRPLLFNWENENGIMPVHQIGIQALGSKEFGPVDLH